MRNIFKYFLAVAILMAFSVSAAAGPAYRGTVVKTQPDGSTVELLIHGDEFYHWLTLDGVEVAKDNDGFYRPVVNSAAKREEAMRRAAAARLARDTSVRKTVTTGSPHSLVILLEFSDVRFVTENPHDTFDKLLNKPGYNTGGATGSVYDYYHDNSSGKFTPVFDVYGPVTLDYPMAYYGRNTGGSCSDTLPAAALLQACVKLDSEIDFSKYNEDGDRYVDNIFFFFAGYSEAAGGPDEAIWPHKGYASTRSGQTVFDGLTVREYACGCELNGTSGKTLTGIGNFCHEYNHLLGLPDLYDVDGSKNGSANGMGSFSIMDVGCYNNGGKTPPYFSTIEKNIVGWMDMPEYLTTSGQYSLEPVENNKAWLLKTDNENEYYVLECRNGNKWDSSLGTSGLMIYHVDQSENIVGNKTASKMWKQWKSYNDINCYADHPLCTMVKSKPSSTSKKNYLWPGSTNATEFNDTTTPAATGWSGQATGHYLSNIAYAKNEVTFSYINVSEQLFQFYAINNPGKGLYKSGDKLTLKLTGFGDAVRSVAWLYDGQAVSGTEVTLESGIHIITATVTFATGSKEVLEQTIKVE